MKYIHSIINHYLKTYIALSRFIRIERAGKGRAPHVRCENCTYRFKRGQLGSRTILVRSLRLLPELSNTQRSVACLLGTVFDGEDPSVYKVAKEAHLDWRVVKKTMLEIKEKEFPIK